MIYELRTYTVAPGRMGDLHRRFREHTLALFAKHGIEPVLFLTPVVGGRSDQLVYLVRFEDLAHRERAWAEFVADEQWQHVYAASSAEGPLPSRFENAVFATTDYSPDGPVAVSAS